MAKELGFKGNVKIQRKVDKVKAEIVDMNNYGPKNALIEMEDGSGRFQLPAKSLLEADRKILKEKVETPIEIKDYKAHLGSSGRKAVGHQGQDT